MARTFLFPSKLVAMVGAIVGSPWESPKSALTLNLRFLLALNWFTANWTARAPAAATAPIFVKNNFIDSPLRNRRSFAVRKKLSLASRERTRRVAKSSRARAAAWTATSVRSTPRRRLRGQPKFIVTGPIARTQTTRDTPFPANIRGEQVFDSDPGLGYPTNNCSSEETHGRSSHPDAPPDPGIHHLLPARAQLPADHPRDRRPRRTEVPRDRRQPHRRPEGRGLHREERPAAAHPDRPPRRDQHGARARGAQPPLRG